MFLKSLLSKVIFSFSLVFGIGGVRAEVPKYPVIKEWQGQAWLTGKDGKRTVIRSKFVLREKALIETSLSGQVKVQLDEKRSLIVLRGSEVFLPVISWESGEAPVVLLKGGDILWMQDLSDKGAYNVALRSDLFEFLAPSGKYILSINPAKAFASVKVFEGSMVFSALNAEESVKVKSGQQAHFQGVIEGGEIAYDVLLKGKKIPRGQLTLANPIDPAELAKIADVDRKYQQSVARKKAKTEAVQEQLKREGVICENPPGLFNECAWVCVNNPKKEKKACLVSAGATCQRQRCNANGEWAEATPVSAEKISTMCKSQPVVAPCDY